MDPKFPGIVVLYCFEETNIEICTTSIAKWVGTLNYFVRVCSVFLCHSKTHLMSHEISFVALEVLKCLKQ